MKKTCMVVLATMLLNVSAVAQKVADKELVGIWLMEYMQWPGENKIECGDKYAQIKIYGADGEYACAEMAVTKEGNYVVLPHEYGTYTFKNGKYTEMGRDGDVVLESKTVFRGKWMGRSDKWVKVSGMPKQLVDYIIFKCKANQPPTKEMQQLIKQNCFKKK